MSAETTSHRRRQTTASPAVPDARVREVVAPALAEYLARSRWFGGQGRELRAARVVATWWLPAGGQRLSLNLVEAEYASGAPEPYLVPLAVVAGARAQEVRALAPGAVIVSVPRNGSGAFAVIDAAVQPDFWRSLLEFLATGGSLAGDGGVLTARVRPGFAALRGADEALEPRPYGEDRSRTAVAYGDRLLLKLLRRPDGGLCPEVEVGGVLTAAGFAHAPALAAHLECRGARGEPLSVAVLEQYLPHDGTAWTRSRAEAAAFFERLRADPFGRRPPPPTSVVAVARSGPSRVVAGAVGSWAAALGRLGRRVAELHLALAGATYDPAFVPEEYTADAQLQEWHAMREVASYAGACVRHSLPRLTGAPRLAGRCFLEDEARVRGRLATFIDRRLSSPRVRGHGDLSLERVLHCGEDFALTDFGGESTRPLPVRRGKRAPVADVASLLRSLHYAVFGTLEERRAAGQVGTAERPVLEKWADAWHACVGGNFLRGYLEAAAGSALVPRDPDELRLLLDVYQLEQGLREVAYEAEHRPEWLHLPMRAVLKLANGSHGRRGRRGGSRRGAA